LKKNSNTLTVLSTTTHGVSGQLTPNRRGLPHESFASDHRRVTAAIYVGAAIEGSSYRHAQLDRIAIIGVAIYIFSALALLWVMHTLGPFWSGKVLIAPGHQLVVHPIFRAIKHPNYFLNMIPELVGFSIMLHAFITLAIGFPLFLISLLFRIRVEEQVLKQKFEAY
jgi:isoprenylcysteine carboxyl methyltransferase (ICMT) family protein YpbQ